MKYYLYLIWVSNSHIVKASPMIGVDINRIKFYVPNGAVLLLNSNPAMILMKL